MNNPHLHVLSHFNLIKIWGRVCLFPSFIPFSQPALHVTRVKAILCCSSCGISISCIVIENRIIKEMQLNPVTTFRNKKNNFNCFIIINYREQF
jgi:hypothetical protein